MGVSSSAPGPRQGPQVSASDIVYQIETNRNLEYDAKVDSWLEFLGEELAECDLPAGQKKSFDWPVDENSTPGHLQLRDTSKYFARENFTVLTFVALHHKSTCSTILALLEAAYQLTQRTHGFSHLASQTLVMRYDFLISQRKLALQIACARYASDREALARIIEHLSLAQPAVRRQMVTALARSGNTQALRLCMERGDVFICNTDTATEGVAGDSKRSETSRKKASSIEKPHTHWWRLLSAAILSFSVGCTCVAWKHLVAHRDLVRDTLMYRSSYLLLSMCENVHKLRQVGDDTGASQWIRVIDECLRVLKSLPGPHARAVVDPIMSRRDAPLFDSNTVVPNRNVLRSAVLENDPELLAMLLAHIDVPLDDIRTRRTLFERNSSLHLPQKRAAAGRGPSSITMQQKQPSRHRNTLGTLAASLGHFECVDLLLQAGCFASPAMVAVCLTSGYDDDCEEDELDDFPLCRQVRLPDGGLEVDYVNRLQVHVLARVVSFACNNHSFDMSVSPDHEVVISFQRTMITTLLLPLAPIECQRLLRAVRRVFSLQPLLSPQPVGYGLQVVLQALKARPSLANAGFGENNVGALRRDMQFRLRRMQRAVRLLELELHTRPNTCVGFDESAFFKRFYSWVGAREWFGAEPDTKMDCRSLHRAWHIATLLLQGLHDNGLPLLPKAVATLLDRAFTGVVCQDAGVLNSFDGISSTEYFRRRQQLLEAQPKPGELYVAKCMRVLSPRKHYTLTSTGDLVYFCMRAQLRVRAVEVVQQMRQRFNVSQDALSIILEYGYGDHVVSLRDVDDLLANPEAVILGNELT
ncbi:MAG: hypothetical protein MHM6MM_001725 [Cercozoa sp. M6MM]